MGTALTIVVMYSLSVFVVRVGTVGLRLTGLSADVAKFQALSAFSGTGFTTRESELIVNYPVRRKILSYLMILGNLGLTAILATVVVGFVSTDGQLDTILVQLVWIISSLLVIWFVMLNSTADRIMCKLIHKVLISTTELGQLSYTRLTQLDDNWEIGEHKVAHGALTNNHISIKTILECLPKGRLIYVRNASGTEHTPTSDYIVTEGDALIILAPRSEQQELHEHIQAAA